MKTLIFSLATLIASLTAHADCGKDNLETLPFFARVRSARTATEEWVTMYDELSEAMLTSMMGIPERTDRTFVRHLVNTYGGEAWTEEKVVIPAGENSFGFDLPEFTVEQGDRHLWIQSKDQLILSWLTAREGRHALISPDQPFSDKFHETEHRLMIYHRKTAVPMLATYLARKANSQDVFDAIRSELDVRAHYFMKVEGNFRRLKHAAIKKD